MTTLPVKSRLRQHLTLRTNGYGLVRPSALSAANAKVLNGDNRHNAPRRRIVMGFVCGFAAAATAWSYSDYAQSYATALGKVQFAAPALGVRPLQTGKLLAIKVSEGSRISKGDAVAELDPADGIAARTAVQKRLDEVRAQIKKLKTAVGAARPKPFLRAAVIQWDDATPKDLKLRESRALREDLDRLSDAIDGLTEQRTFAIFRRDRAQASIQAERAYLDVLSTQFEMRNQLVKQNADSKMNLLDLLKEIKRGEIELRSFESNLIDASGAVMGLEAQTTKALESFKARNEADLNEAENAKMDLEQELAHSMENGHRVTVFAPISGTVRALPHAIGQLVTPAEALVTIEPADDNMPEIVAYLPKRDIGRVEVDQDAIINFASISGEDNSYISGKVLRVMTGDGQGAVKGSGPAEATNGAGPEARDKRMSRVLVAPSANSIKSKGGVVPLSPGMAVQVTIKTGKRRLVDYLLAPFMMLTSGAVSDI